MHIHNTADRLAPAPQSRLNEDAEVRRLQAAVRRMFTGRAQPAWVRDLLRDDPARVSLFRRLVKLTTEAKGAKPEDRYALSLALHELAEAVEPTAHLSLAEVRVKEAEADAKEDEAAALAWCYPTEGALARHAEALDAQAFWGVTLSRATKRVMRLSDRPSPVLAHIDHRGRK